MYLKKKKAVYEHLYSQSLDEPENKAMKQKKNFFLEDPVQNKKHTSLK